MKPYRGYSGFVCELSLLSRQALRSLQATTIALLLLVVPTGVSTAGAVGAPAAFLIATRLLANEIVMIGGKRQNVLQQHVMDISTAVSDMDVIVRAGTYKDMEGSRIVINAAGAHIDGASGRMDMLLENIPFIREIAKEIKKYCRMKEGFDSLRHDGLRKVLSGVTTIEQVLGAL